MKQPVSPYQAVIFRRAKLAKHKKVLSLFMAHALSIAIARDGFEDEAFHWQKHLQSCS
jgi:hypothetical protein